MFCWSIKFPCLPYHSDILIEHLLFSINNFYAIWHNIFTAFAFCLNLISHTTQNFQHGHRIPELRLLPRILRIRQRGIKIPEANQNPPLGSICACVHHPRGCCCSHRLRNRTTAPLPQNIRIWKSLVIPVAAESRHPPNNCSLSVWMRDCMFEFGLCCCCFASVG